MSFLCFPFILFPLLLFRFNANDENHEYLAPVNNENSTCNSTGLVVIEDPKEIQNNWNRFEQNRIIINEPLVEINLGTEEKPRNLMIGGGLTNEQSGKLIQLLSEYIDVFAWSYEDMPGLDPSIVVHKLPTISEAKPKKQKLRRFRPDILLKIKEEVKKLLEVGFIEVSNYPEWVANVVPVLKKNGKVRVCVDFRDLNQATPKDNFPLPHIDVLVDNTAGNHLFSFMDGFSGYNQIRMAEEDKTKTTFTTAWGTFCYRVMPFGLKNAGATYQRAMVALFHDLMHKEVEVYVDDIIAKSKQDKNHVEVLRRLFERLRKFQLKLNPEKCTFGVTSGKLLGFIVSEKGIEVDPDKVKAIVEMPPPRTLKEVRGLLGRLNYIARFVSQLTDKCRPFFKLLRKNALIEWDEECEQAFSTIKEYLMNPPILIAPTPGKSLFLYLTILPESMGSMLGQNDEEGHEHAIYYLSKKFNEGEQKYSEVERTCCALVWVMHRLRQYTLYYSVELLTRHDPLKYLSEKPALIGRISKWQMLLSEFDIKYINQGPVKGQALADHLAEYPSEIVEQNVEVNFPDENVMTTEGQNVEEQSETPKWKLYFDGAANVFGCGIGAVLVSPKSDHFPVAARLTFPYTNNIAEYEACILGVKMALDMGIRELEVYGDSSLIILQTLGEYKTKDSKLVPYHQHLIELVGKFKTISFAYIPRTENQFADALATLASMVKVSDGIEVQPLKIEVEKRPAFCLVTDEVEEQKPWYYDIMTYLQNNEYPKNADSKDRKALRRLALHFLISGSTLYKRSFDTTLLRCVDEKEAEQLMKEVHKGVCGPHMNGHMLARKIMRMGYFWMTMEADCIKFVRHYHPCQVYANRINAPPQELHVLSAPWPFSM